MTVGTTTTGDPGTDALVTQGGTADNVILNFTIPRGETGPSAVAANVPLVTDPTMAEAPAVAATLNQLITNLVEAGIIATGAAG